MNVKIRPIKITDSKDIAKYLFNKVDEKSVMEQVEKDIKRVEKGSIMRCVAEVDNKVVGQSQMNINPSPIKQHIAEVFGVVVAEDYQGKGISSQLMDYCIEWARKKGCEKITLGVRKGTKAEKVYRHMGFIEYGELKESIKEPWGDKKIYDEVFMFKNIL